MMMKVTSKFDFPHRFLLSNALIFVIKIAMPRYLILILAALSFGLSLGAQTGETAMAIVRKADERVRGKTSIAEMTIITTRPKWTRSMDIKAWTKGNDYTLILVAAPAKDKGTVFLKRKKEVWNWLPSLERTIKLPPSMMSQSWMGTDFTNDDLVKESSIVEDYEHKLLGVEQQGGRDCHKIELIPKPEAAIVWGKILVWIDKKDYLQMRSEFYDEFGALSQTMIGSELKMLGGILLPSRLEMIPSEKKGHSTTLVYKALAFNKPIEDNFFTTAQLSKVK